MFAKKPERVPGFPSRNQPPSAPPGKAPSSLPLHGGRHCGLERFSTQLAGRRAGRGPGSLTESLHSAGGEERSSPRVPSPGTAVDLTRWGGAGEKPEVGGDGAGRSRRPRLGAALSSSRDCPQAGAPLGPTLGPDSAQAQAPPLRGQG